MILLWYKITCFNIFMQAGNQDSLQHSMQPDAEITMRMDVDEGSYHIFKPGMRQPAERLVS